MKLSLTYSAFRELEQIFGSPLRAIGEAIVNLAQDPQPSESSIFEGKGGCRALPIKGYSILYHLDEQDDSLTVLGVVDSRAATLH